MTAVPFLDLAAPYAELRAELDATAHRVLAGGWYLHGAEGSAFEGEFARYCGASHTVGVSNGLDALHLVLRAWDIGAGDEVIVPAHTFIASWLAVTYAGATPVPVDVDPTTFTLDVAQVERAITPRTRCLMPVHLYGHPCDMDPLRALARAHGLRILEDAAQAHGARYRGQRTGSLGDAAAFSFYPGKNLGAMGDGGAVVTNDAALADRVRRLANYGSAVKYVHEEPGFNARLDEMQAAILRVKLRALDHWNARRVSRAARYTAALHGSGLVLPAVAPWAEPVWHLYVVRTPDRQAVQARLANRGVQTLVHYPTPPHRQGAYARAPFVNGAFPVTETLAEEVLSLPMGPHLTDEQQDAVIAALLAG